jgi:hypothetical protein
MSKSEKRLKAWLRTTGVIYALGAVDFVARPKAATSSLSHYGGDVIVPEEPPGLYNSLASAYMATIAALALSAAQYPDHRRALIPPLLVAKAVSSGLMLYRFTQTKKRGFALGAAMDAFLFGVTAGLYSNLD